MLKGFRDFIMRGNVIDLAVAVVIGTAFTAVVAAFSAAFINPMINIFLKPFGGKLGGTFTIAKETFNLGQMITAIITFVITAAVVYFVFVLPMNKFRETFGKTDVEKKVSEEVALLKEIRDELRARNGN